MQFLKNTWLLCVGFYLIMDWCFPYQGCAITKYKFNPFAYDQKTYQKAVGKVFTPNPGITDQKVKALQEKDRYRFDTLCFISLGMPEASLKALFRDQDTAKKKVLFVLRGFADNVLDTKDHLTALLRKDTKPNKYNRIQLNIDPVVFTRHQVNKVPTYIQFDESNKPLFRMSGDVSPDFFFEKTQTAKKYSDLGTYDKVYEITERNLMEEMQTKTAAINWKEKFQEAWERKFEQFPKYQFPASKKTYDYIIDPSVTLDHDIKDIDGKVLVAAGATVNPFDYMPLQKRIIIFDANSQSQKELVKHLIKIADKPVVLLTTEAMNIMELIKYFNHRVFLLDDLWVKRLKIKELPLSAEQLDKRMVVKVYEIN